jgi:hypothetical protein
VSRKHPYEEFSFAHWMSQLEDNIINGTRPTIAATCLPDYQRLIQDCWASSPETRPTFSSILDSLNDISKLLPLEPSAEAKNHQEHTVIDT